jgi:peptidoglycan/xylan/chitin deacetylase (PgdA/CDA1 family)
MRKIIRHIALSLLYIKDFKFAHSMCDHIPRIHFIYLHHIRNDEMRGFRKLLKLISNYPNIEFTSHSHAVNLLSSFNSKKIYITLSFDDGLKSCLNASKIMDEFNIKGCFYVNCSMIGNKNYNETSKFSKNRLNMSPQEFLSWNDLSQLSESGHEIGNHTYSHLNCSQLSLSEFKKDIDINHKVLTDHNIIPHHFSWPYGGKTNIRPEMLQYIQERGYSSAASAVRGCHTNKSLNDPYFIFREHFVAKWPLHHMKYFLSRSALNSPM